MRRFDLPDPNQGTWLHFFCGTDKIDPATSMDMEVIDSQEPPIHEIEINSTPSGGEIQLDGNFVGGTPSTIGLSAADHLITINKNGYKP